MSREQVIDTLRAHERELKEAGIVRLSLFGSTARNNAGPDSDVDLLAAFDEGRRLFPVDLSEEGMLNPQVQKSVEAEGVRAF